MRRRRVRFRPARIKQRRKSGKARRLVRFGVVLIIIVGLALYFESRLSPVVERLANARVNYLAGKAINDAINGQISSAEINYNDLIRLEKDVNGHITALRTDMIKINQFKALIIGDVLDQVAGIEETELFIPLGNIINGEIFSGRGPKIPLVLVPLGTADAQFISVFKSVGINQSRHQIIVEVKVRISVLLPGFSSATEVSSQVSIAETIIVGNVPEAYTYLEDTGQTGMDIYGDFDLDGNR